MNPEQLRGLLLEVAKGERDVESAIQALKALPFSDLGFARVDQHRALRQGLPEVVLAQGKSPSQIAQISAALIDAGVSVFVTRLEPEKAAAVTQLEPRLIFHPESETASFGKVASPALGGDVLVVTAGTSDLKVAHEALETLRVCGVGAELIADVGVAGLHRLLAHMERLMQARALIVIAGMEGALASVVGGLVAAPVVAVPTSVGYGASFDGLAALLGMLTTCAAGVTVVNVDNGFGAAVAVLRMIKAAERHEPKS